MRRLRWFLAGAITLAILLAGAGVVYLKTIAHGLERPCASNSAQRLRSQYREGSRPAR